MTSLRRTAALVALALAVGAAPLDAQVVDQKALTLAGARAVAEAAAAEARKHDAGGAIAVVDAGGNLVFLQRLDNTFPAAAAVSIEKARTAAIRRPTRDFENAVKNGRTALLGVSVMTPLQGGVPIVVDGQVVGAIGVSGAASAQQDDDIATAASTALAAGARSARKP